MKNHDFRHEIWKNITTTERWHRQSGIGNRFQLIDTERADEQSVEKNTACRLRRPHDVARYWTIAHAMIYAALIFEYVDKNKTLSNFKKICKKGGHLAILLQLPKESLANVSPSPYASLSDLACVMRLVAPAAISQAAQDIGFSCESAKTITLKSNKEFS